MGEPGHLGDGAKVFGWNLVHEARPEVWTVQQRIEIGNGVAIDHELDELGEVLDRANV